MKKNNEKKNNKTKTKHNYINQVHVTQHRFKDYFEIRCCELELGWKNSQFLPLPSHPQLFHTTKFEV